MAEFVFLFEPDVPPPTLTHTRDRGKGAPSGNRILRATLVDRHSAETSLQRSPLRNLVELAEKSSRLTPHSRNVSRVL